MGVSERLPTCNGSHTEGSVCTHTHVEMQCGFICLHTLRGVIFTVSVKVLLVYMLGLHAWKLLIPSTQSVAEQLMLMMTIWFGWFVSVSGC